MNLITATNLTKRYIDGDNTVPSHCLVTNGSAAATFLRDNAFKLGIDPFKLPPKETFCYLAVTERLAKACLVGLGPLEFSVGRQSDKTQQKNEASE